MFGIARSSLFDFESSCVRVVGALELPPYQSSYREESPEVYLARCRGQESVRSSYRSSFTSFRVWMFSWMFMFHPPFLAHKCPIISNFSPKMSNRPTATSTPRARHHQHPSSPSHSTTLVFSSNNQQCQTHQPQKPSPKNRSKSSARHVNKFEWIKSIRRRVFRPARNTVSLPCFSLLC
jgi:hypothetical protein